MLRNEFMAKLFKEVSQNYDSLYIVIKRYENNKIQTSDIRFFCGENNLSYDVLFNNVNNIPILNHDHLNPIFQYYISIMKLNNEIKTFKTLNRSNEELESSFWSAHDFNRKAILDCFPEGKKFLESKKIPVDLER